MTEQEKAFFEGKGMSEEEIKEYFKKKAASGKGSFELENERLKKELEDFKARWLEEAIGGFLNSKGGKKFVKEHEGKSPAEMLEILLDKSNLGKLYNQALKKKISELRGEVQ